MTAWRRGLEPRRSPGAYLSFAAGGIAASIGAIRLLTAAQFGLRYSDDLPETLTDIGVQIRIRLMTASFDMLLPLAAMLALIFGLSNWRHPASQLGLICSVFALTVYFYALKDALGSFFG